MMTHDEMIRLIQAHKEGKEIEFKHRTDAMWTPCLQPLWEFHTFNYRIKPEPKKPRVIWVNQYDGPCVYGYNTEVEALKNRADGGTTRKFIEVIDEE